MRKRRDQVRFHPARLPNSLILALPRKRGIDKLRKNAKRENWSRGISKNTKIKNRKLRSRESKKSERILGRD